MRSWKASTLCKDAAPELILGQVAEESFDHVEPTAAGGREVEMKALVWRAAQRRTTGCFLGGIVVDDQVQLFVGGRLAIDETQELQPFLMAITLDASSHHTAVEGVSCARRKLPFLGVDTVSCGRFANRVEVLQGETNRRASVGLTSVQWLLFEYNGKPKHAARGSSTALPARNRRNIAACQAAAGLTTTEDPTQTMVVSIHFFFCSSMKASLLLY